MTAKNRNLSEQSTTKSNNETKREEPWYLAIWEAVGFKVPALVIIGAILGIFGSFIYFKDHPVQDINLLVEATLAARPTLTQVPSATSQPTSAPMPTVQSASAQTAPVFHLSSIGFITGNWKPRMIDLRTADTIGIYAPKDFSLGLFDLRVADPEKLQGNYKVQAEVYVNDDGFIGRTDMATLVPRETQLGNVSPVNYIHDTTPNAWRIQAGWEKLTILVNLYDETGKTVLTTYKEKIKLSPTETTSWWVSPPYASFSTIVYQVNDGEKNMLDFRTAETEGLYLKAGDTLTISELWYHSTMDGDPGDIYIFGEIYSGSKGEYVNNSHRDVDISQIKEGAYSLLGNKPFVWENLPEQSWLVLNITRRDYGGIERSTLLDRLEIPLVK